MPTPCVYILTNHSRGLYHGFSVNLRDRVRRHKRGLGTEFTRKYRINRLVYFEALPDVRSALIREKELKRWPRERKIRLIEQYNPDWRDLSLDW